MRTIFSMASILFLAGTIVPTKILFSQTNFKVPRNEIEIGYFHSFYFDGIPVYPFQTYDSVDKHILLGIHTAYRHTIFKERFVLEGAICFWAEYNKFPPEYLRGNTPYRLKEGTMLGRAMFLFSANISYPVAIKKKIQVFPHLGMNFRVGGESYLGGYLGFDLGYVNYSYRDLGINIGGRVPIYRKGKWTLSFEVNYTRYVFLYAVPKWPDIPGTGWPPKFIHQATSPNLLTVGLNVSLGWGK